jgi:ankyrin repeat protein
LQDADGEEDEEDTATQQLETWEPSQREREEWDETVLRIVAEVDAQRDAAKVEVVPSGFDRNGKVAAVSYRNSLPPFLRAAADGDLEVLRNMVAEAENVFELLNTRDRHLSTAEHWAAGSGHLYCLQFLCRLQKTEQPEEEHASSVAAQSSRRRRDGKTSLHYAARNGRVPVMQYLIEQEKVAVDCPSNDGTTPFHLACFGGHLAAIHYLLSKGANVLQENDWGCSAAHWVAMTKSTDRENIRQLCNLLKSRGVSFTDRQKQGHTALHKAAQRQNRHVIEWLAESRDEGGAGLFDEEKRRCSQPDDGGHTPAEIWLSCGGDKDFADKMKKEFGG